MPLTGRFCSANGTSTPILRPAASRSDQDPTTGLTLRMWIAMWGAATARINPHDRSRTEASSSVRERDLQHINKTIGSAGDGADAAWSFEQTHDGRAASPTLSDWLQRACLRVPSPSACCHARSVGCDSVRREGGVTMPLTKSAFRAGSGRRSRAVQVAALVMAVTNLSAAGAPPPSVQGFIVGPTVATGARITPTAAPGYRLREAQS